MSRPTGLSVVLGATGGIGAAVVREVTAQGRPVRAVSQSVPADPSPAAEHRRGQVRVTIGHSSDYYGPGGTGSSGRRPSSTSTR